MLNRRELLAAGGTALTSCALASAAPDNNADPAAEPFRYCLNTSTIRGQGLSVPDQVAITARAGYGGIELWIRDIRQHVEQGGSLREVRRRIDDSGLSVESVIGFANWIVDDDAQRAAGLETARRDMELVREIGGTRIAAPPAGATRQSDLDLFRAAERYRALLELGEEIGVKPQLELWGFSKTISRLGELLFVAAESGHAGACLLPDVYHIYKGGSEFAGLKLVSGRAMHVFHMNDYPADPPRETIGDADRVYPGDGIAPLSDILRGLHQNGFHGALSLELFNRDYWQQDALLVARTGLDKMKAVVAASLESAS